MKIGNQKPSNQVLSWLDLLRGFFRSWQWKQRGLAMAELHGSKKKNAICRASATARFDFRKRGCLIGGGGVLEARLLTA